MKSCNVIMDLIEGKLYNVNEFLDNFDVYFGMSFLDVSDFLMKYQVISISEIVKYIDDNFDLMEEVKYNGLVMAREGVINSRMKDYQYYKEVLDILSNKGRWYLSSLRYLCSLSNIDIKLEEYEIFFEQADINHYGSVTTGRELNRLLGVLSNVVMLMQDILVKANTLENYNRIRIDSFARTFGYDMIYPTKKLVLDTNDYLDDKTSLIKIGRGDKGSNFSYVKVKKLNNRGIK